MNEPRVAKGELQPRPEEQRLQRGNRISGVRAEVKQEEGGQRPGGRASERRLALRLRPRPGLEVHLHSQRLHPNLGTEGAMDLATRYGRRAGLLRHGFARSLALLGVYEDARAVRWAEVRRLVFVCQGNLCRSAYAAAKAQALGLAAASCGLAARQRFCADPRAVARAAARGIDLCAHRTTSATAFVVANGDLLLAMEPRQLRSLG